MSAMRTATAVLAVAMLAALPACNKSKGAGPAAAAGSNAAPSSVTQIGVNAYLWQASLDVLSFMPLADSEPTGGVLTTEWYASPTTPNDRVKVTVHILDKDLRADALRVTVNRQQLGAAGWVEAPVQAGTVQKLEDAILTKARELRQQQMPSK